MERGPVGKFIEKHYLHFNAASVVDAARDYEKFLADGHVMLMTLAGAMSTAELGKSLAEMIRQGKVHAISCTGANLEEDVFNLVAHDHYCRLPDWRGLSRKDEQDLHSRGMNRVTDTCIPEDEAIRRLEGALVKVWQDADQNGERYFPYEFLYKILLNGDLEQYYQIDPKDSWLLAAAQKNLPIVTPGWEDSTTGNIYAGHCISGDIKNHGTVKLGIDAMMLLADWYTETTRSKRVGFFQIGGGIAGDFPICVVPMINQDLQRDVPVWAYFCQISDAPTSYGGYSGATPSEKITWGKLDLDSYMHIIESDATIVAPLIFAYLLGW